MLNSYLEGPFPPDTVVPFGNHHQHSRLGPVFEARNGVFQSVISGKYPCNPELSSSENNLSSSCITLTAPIPSIQHLNSPWEPGRMQLCIMEASDPSEPVESETDLHSHSRPGPVFGGGDEVFQPAIIGKYLHCSSMVGSDGFPPSSTTSMSIQDADYNVKGPLCSDVSAFETPPNDSTMIPSPRRTTSSILGVPSSSVTVAPHDVGSSRSRLGPVYGTGEGVSQPANPGKYSSINSIAIPQARLICSDPVLHLPASENLDSGECLLHVYYQNVRGLRTKIDEFFLAASDSCYDVIVLTETWLDDRISSTQLFGNSFTVFRNDRNMANSTKSRGGGVLIAVATRLSCCLDPTSVCDTLEQLWIRITTHTGIVSIGVIYLPPDRRANVIDIQNHVESIGAILAKLAISDIVIQFGDYNQPNLVWSTLPNELPVIDLQQSYVSEPSSILLDGFSLNGLTQINPVPNQNNRILDFVLANDNTKSGSKVSIADEPLIDLDRNHPALEVTVKVPLPKVFEDVVDLQLLDFHRADYTSLCSTIFDIDWQTLEMEACVDDAVDYYTEKVNQAITSCVPLRRPAPKPPWSNSRLRQLKRLRSRALRNYCSTRCLILKRVFAQASKNYRLYNRILYKRYVVRTQNSLRRNPKRFWSFVNSKRKENGLPVEMHLKGTRTSTLQGKCNLFAEHFKAAFNCSVASDTEIIAALEGTPSDTIEFSAFGISTHLVKAAIEKLKPSYSVGPDGIPACVLKKCANAFVYPLTVLFNASLTQRKFPTCWKKSVLFPVHKKGDKSDIENYRGITSLCASSKVLEIIINDSLFTNCQRYISSAQHGFFPKRSVSTNLIQFLSTCLRSMDSGAQVDAVYTDLKAAFDRVDHGILLARLAKIGMTPAFVTWFKSYLSGRSLCVKIRNESSETFTNTSGVPQGSNLGPLLFVLFINEIDIMLRPGCRMLYADDVKIFMIIRNLQDCLDLQTMVDCFETWCMRNFMTVSISKCSIISFHRKIKPFVFNYTISEHPLNRVTQVRDLGVTLDSALTFRAHYTDVICKANRQLGFIIKISSEFRDPLCLRSLYCSLVRSILESSVVAWCPYHANWIARIESVQKKFVRFALRTLPWNDPLNLPPYDERCQLLGLTTLERRRSIAQAVFVAKMLKGEIDAPAILSEINIYAPERRLRQRDFLHLGPRSVQYAQHDPVRFMCRTFNELFDFFDFNLTTRTFQQRLSLRR